MKKSPKRKALLLLLWEREEQAESTNYRQSFDLDVIKDDLEFCREHFRFTMPEIKRIAQLIGLEGQIILENRCKINSVFAMCILLKRFAYPSRLSDMEYFFGISRSTISRVVSYLVTYLFEKYSKKLTWDASFLNRAKLVEYEAAIKNKGLLVINTGGILDGTFGFIDGTVRGICRPSRYQKRVYNGHKRKHALKFQSVSAPDGLIIHLSGPWVGRRHDARMLRESGLMDMLASHCTFEDECFRVYGDPAYGMCDHIASPFKGVHLSREQLEFNKRMSSVRVSVEWCFGDIVRYFAFLDFAKNMKILLQPVGIYYSIGALLTNIHTCLYGNVTSQFFNLNPPSLEEYLS